MTAPLGNSSPLAGFIRRIGIAIVLTVVIGLGYGVLKGSRKAPTPENANLVAQTAATAPAPNVVSSPAAIAPGNVPRSDPVDPGITPPPNIEPPDAPPRNPSPASRWMVSERGIGPVMVGMTADSAAAALGAYFKVTRDARGCRWAVWPTAPVGVVPLVSGDRIIGVSVTKGNVETTTHVKIGSTETDVWHAYMPPNDSIDRVSRRPRTYRLGMNPSNDPNFEIEFEIVNGVVASYLAGNVGWVHHQQPC